MTRDLKRCGLEEGWREKARDRDTWRQDIAKKTEELNAEDEKEKQHRKYENRKKLYEEREIQSEIALNCDWPRCNFNTNNRSCLVNHQRQSHGPLQLIPCPYSGRELRCQGLHNHKQFCKARPTVP